MSRSILQNSLSPAVAGQAEPQCLGRSCGNLNSPALPQMIRLSHTHPVQRQYHVLLLIVIRITSFWNFASNASHSDSKWAGSHRFSLSVCRNTNSLRHLRGSRCHLHLCGIGTHRRPRPCSFCLASELMDKRLSRSSMRATRR